MTRGQIKEMTSSQSLVERGLSRNGHSFVIVSQLCCWLQAFRKQECPLCNIVALFFRVLSRDPQLQQLPLPPPFQRCSCSLSEQPHDQTECVR